MFNNQSKNNSTDPKKGVVTPDPKKDAPKIIDPKKDSPKTDPKKDDRIKN